MVDAMANSVIHYIPDAMGSHFAVVTAILSAPLHSLCLMMPLLWRTAVTCKGRSSIWH